MSTLEFAFLVVVVLILVLFLIRKLAPRFQAPADLKLALEVIAIAAAIYLIMQRAGLWDR